MTRNGAAIARVVLCILLVVIIAAPACSAPAILQYQAKLTNGNGTSITSPVTVTFTFWDAQSGGNQLGGGFADADIVTPSANGVISTDVGDSPGLPIPVSVFARDSLWLNVNVNGTDQPRTRVEAAAGALNALALANPAFMIAESTTADPATNGANLIATYNRAKLLTPHGQPLSAANRGSVLVPPGQYDLGTAQLTMDTEFLDLAGLTSIRENQHIYGTSNGVGTGVLRQTANNVHIENVSVECTRISGTLPSDATGPAAYFPDSGTTASVLRNCQFHGTANSFSTRIGTDYPGSFTDCTGQADSFGAFSGEASGVFTNCTGDNDSFGGFGAKASGTFANCTGGAGAFGGDKGTASGTFTYCTGGSNSFGGGSGGFASGTFSHCTGGDYSFGGKGAAFAQFSYCVGATGAFGGAGGGASGNFTDCIGGDSSFGGDSGAVFGTYNHCVAGTNSFGGPHGRSDSARFLYCAGTTGSFGATAEKPANGNPTRAGTSPPTYLYCLLNGIHYP